ncbi:hypothetical protein D6850_17295 [Roseovarius spongiae]|uniref:Uncharacterized protein n=1 Tax=Roseovarius spongiae TaxID=2320272 RepID=A0A3A8AQQ0_9RHOB|nr:hypothetical protein [Roseovarius spongiae]RKF12712.1 hypothetical protein D6850_17295 [Roseovarius spongiae]
MTDDKTSKEGDKEFPEIGDELSRNEIMAVLANEGYPAGGRKGWLKEVLTHLAAKEGRVSGDERDELVAEIREVLDENVSGDPKADDSL